MTVAASAPNKKNKILATKRSSSFRNESIDPDMSKSKSSIAEAVSPPKTNWGNELVALRSRNKIMTQAINGMLETANDKIAEKFDLVWFALNRCRFPNHPASQRIENEQKYKDDLENLRGNDSDFHHGFNMGVLATSRMFKEHVTINIQSSIFSEIDDKIQNSRKSFPITDIDQFPTQTHSEIPSVNTSSMSPENEVMALRARNKILKDVLEAVKETATIKITEKFDLVWFAQNRCRFPNHQDTSWIEKAPEYQNEIAKLRGNDGDFHHGFNSGVLATSRMFKQLVNTPALFITDASFFLKQASILSEQKEKFQEAKMSFPKLDVDMFPSEVRSKSVASFSA